MHPDIKTCPKLLQPSKDTFKCIQGSYNNDIFFYDNGLCVSFFFLYYLPRVIEILSITDACILYYISNSDLCLSGKTFYTGNHGAMVCVTYFM